jgi:predicted GH43/DUF377 family glycosyl hydrolase
MTDKKEVELMQWGKRGRVFVANDQEGWRRSHAYLPTPFRISESTIRVYTAFLDEEKFGRIGYVDVSAEDPITVFSVSAQPVLDLGTAGCFDDCGVAPSSVVRRGDEIWLYYQGFQRTVRVPYLIYSGLAISRDNGNTFERVSQAPVLDRSPTGLLVRSAPFVLPPESPSEPWRMWNCSGSESFVRARDGWAPIYGLAYTESCDGIRWNSLDTVAIAPNWPDEFGIARPYVRKKGALYEMFYSVRSESNVYRLGYATSHDAVEWKRRDAEIGIDVSEAGWDSEMIAYPSIIETEFGEYLFYNGNRNGAAGFGVAVREANK